MTLFTFFSFWFLHNLISTLCSMIWKKSSEIEKISSHIWKLIEWNTKNQYRKIAELKPNTETIKKKLIEFYACFKCHCMKHSVTIQSNIPMKYQLFSILSLDIVSGSVGVGWSFLVHFIRYWIAPCDMHTNILKCAKILCTHKVVKEKMSYIGWVCVLCGLSVRE